jgi:hypothetical protein
LIDPGIFIGPPDRDSLKETIQRENEKSRREDEKKRKKVGEKFVFTEKRGIL